MESSTCTNVEMAKELSSPLNTDLFLVKTGNEWIADSKLRPVPSQLFSEFWYENEICILFADTGVGKSILAVQMADSISKGVAMPGFRLGVPAQKVLYLDFELTDKQFEARYSENYSRHYQWNDNFLRVEVNPDVEMPERMPYERYLANSIDALIRKYCTKILIVDNITFLREEMEKANNALPLMKELKALKSRHNLSLLILAHTPKRDLASPITRNDLSGSKMLMNFCDSSFAIGESADGGGVRYLKQIKQRNCEQLYGAENVVVTKLNKESNFLGFKFVDYGSESAYLRTLSDKDKKQVERDILEYCKLNPGASLRAIADKFNVNHMRVKRIIEKSAQ